jgi:hypothetical protein
MHISPSLTADRQKGYEQSQSSYSIKDPYSTKQECSTLFDKPTHQTRLVPILAWGLPPVRCDFTVSLQISYTYNNMARLYRPRISSSIQTQSIPLPLLLQQPFHPLASSTLSSPGACIRKSLPGDGCTQGRNRWLPWQRASTDWRNRMMALLPSALLLSNR